MRSPTGASSDSALRPSTHTTSAPRASAASHTSESAGNSSRDSTTSLRSPVNGTADCREESPVEIDGVSATSSGSAPMSEAYRPSSRRISGMMSSNHRRSADAFSCQASRKRSIAARARRPSGASVWVPRNVVVATAGNSSRQVIRSSSARGSSIRPSCLPTLARSVPAMGRGAIVMGLLFFPRGGSAQVTKYLAVALGDAGWEVSLVAGSLGSPGDGTHAPTFFAGLPLQHLDYTAAVDAFVAGRSAVAAPVPMHPSYEDRQDAPDVVLAAVDPSLERHLADVWEAPLAAAGAGEADVLHLHHLTQQHEAARSRWPEVPVVAHLHGTEIKLIEAIEARAALATELGSSLASMPEAVAAGALDTAFLDEGQRELLATTRWSQWRHGEHWAGHLRRQAQAVDHLVVVSPPDRATAIEVLGVSPERVTDVPNGVETDRFRPRPASPDERRARFRRWLVEDPQGWDASGVAGTVRYREADLDRLLGPEGDATVLIYVGRFTDAKRVPLLVRAFARARVKASRGASLLVWGGHPGEVEGEHPVNVAAEVGSDGLFFAGWRGHEDLPEGLATCDVLVMPSVNDSYPQTPLEAMATGLPVLATLSGGFPSMVNVDPAEPTGWLVPPDDLDALVDALVEVVDDPAEVRRRGAAALAHARAELSWAGRVGGFEHAYAAARERQSRRPQGG